MQINQATYETRRLILEVSSLPEALRFAKTFVPGDYEITKAKSKRSLNANSYAWVLIDLLAKHLSLTKTEIYRDAIRNIGGVSAMATIPKNDAEKVCREWCRDSIGRQTEILAEVSPGYVDIVLYLGSSSYDTHQMSLLIDSLVQDCHALEIETRTPEEIQSLLESWHDKENKSACDNAEG